MKSNLPYPDSNLYHRSSFSWSAVLSGALIALGLSFLLQLFSLATGLSAYHTNASGTTLAIGGLLGLILGTIVSMGIAGFVSGCLGRYCCYHSSEAVIYGFSAWSLALLLSALLMLPLTKYASSYKETLFPKVLVSEELSKHVEVTQKTPATTSKAQSTNNVSQTEVKVTPTALTGGSWTLFLLFFIGAISSCAGAYCGMNCSKKHKALGNDGLVRDPKHPHL